MALPKPKYVPKIRRQEASEQQQFINWFRKEFPGVIIYTDFAAGMKMTDNQRILLMSSRSHDGMPDIYIDHATTHKIKMKDGSIREVTYHGARFEMKKTGFTVYKKDGVSLRAAPYTRKYRRGGKLFIKRGDHLQDQALTLRDYERAGFYARFVRGLEHAKRHARWFMNAESETLDLF